MSGIEQFTLMLRPRGRGGARPGAGRKRTSRKVGHEARGEVSPNYPLHITLRVLPELGNLRELSRLRAIQAGFWAGPDRSGFRLVHYSIQSTHIHLIVEAE